MIHPQSFTEEKKYLKYIGRKNKIDKSFYNGVYNRYVNPILTRESIPPTWKFDLNKETNPYFMERLGVNAIMNSGAIFLNGKFCLVCRVEGIYKLVFSTCTSYL